MNRLQYYLLNKVHDERKLDGHYLETLWHDYCFYSQEYSFPIYFSKSDFMKLFSTTYDVLGLRLNEEESKTVLNQYLVNLECDACTGSLVNTSWAIDHIWYCIVGVSKDINRDKYRDCLPLIQEKLIHCFGIEENFSTKLKRKTMTKFYINC